LDDEFGAMATTANPSAPHEDDPEEAHAQNAEYPRFGDRCDEAGIVSEVVQINAFARNAPCKKVSNIRGWPRERRRFVVALSPDVNEEARKLA